MTASSAVSHDVWKKPVELCCVHHDAACFLGHTSLLQLTSFAHPPPPPPMATPSPSQLSATKVTNPFPPSSQEEWVQSLLAATCWEHFCFLHFSSVCSLLISFLSSGMFLQLPQWTQCQAHSLPFYPSHDHRALEFQYTTLSGHDSVNVWFLQLERFTVFLTVFHHPSSVAGLTIATLLPASQTRKFSLTTTDPLSSQPRP